jgi:hypothetical protein
MPMAQKSIHKSLALTSRTDFLLFWDTMTTDQDIGRFTMSIIMHRETEKLPADFLIHTFQTKDYNECDTQPATVTDVLLLKTKEVSHNS